MTAETENQHGNLELSYNNEEFRLEGNSNGGYMDKACLYNHSSVGDGTVTFSEGNCHVDINDQFEGELEGKAENHTVSCSSEVPFCKSIPGSGEGSSRGYPFCIVL
ncbi:uncharacterized protein LOC109818092 [Cajanus cajan]|uniref:uncharacterized protein LOC109818092 n=1 Tax=Cajanus cajan TaxID=3821 RepID=UPI0010FB4292|nr:uncharacterized protein LOC109818092 [Cajanus cajan]